MAFIFPQVVESSVPTNASALDQSKQLPFLKNQDKALLVILNLQDAQH